MEQRNELLDACNEFVRREYGEDAEPIEMSEEISIAYTETDGHEIEMFINVPELRLEQYIDGELTDIWDYTDLNSLAWEMRHISFDELVSPGFNAERLIYEDEDDG